MSVGLYDAASDDRNRSSKISTYTSQIYPQSQLRFFLLFYSVRSQHVSAPTGHPQVKYYIIYIYFESAIDTTTDPLFYSCSLM
jgi:hypothetical protein